MCPVNTTTFTLQSNMYMTCKPTQVIQGIPGNDVHLKYRHPTQVVDHTCHTIT